MELRYIFPHLIDECNSNLFKEDRDVMTKTLEEQCGKQFMEVYPANIHHPYPIGITSSYFVKMKEVIDVMHYSIHALMNCYFDFPELSDCFLKLSPEIYYLLLSAKDLPYQIGSWRPDILFPQNSDEFLICEINARYPLNGYIASYLKNKILQDLPYLSNIPFSSIKELDQIPSVFESIFDKNEDVFILNSRPASGWDMKLFNSMGNISLSSTGHSSRFRYISPDDIFYEDSLKAHVRLEIDETEEHGGSCSMPHSLCDNDSANSERRLYPVTTMTVKQVIFDCPQSQLVAVGQLCPSSDSSRHDSRDTRGDTDCSINFHSRPCPPVASGQSDTPPSLEGNTPVGATPHDRVSDTLLHLISTCKCINDIRTILLVHDKRLLSVLTNAPLMEKILRHYENAGALKSNIGLCSKTIAQKVSILQSHIVPTYVIGNPMHEAVVRDTLIHPEQYLMKPNLYGKGRGIVFGYQCTREEWRNILLAPSCEYSASDGATDKNKSVALRFNSDVIDYVIQPLCRQHLTSIYNDKMQHQQMHIVGLLHCYNHIFLGPGIFRASTPDHPIVNVAGGNGIILSPVLVSDRWTRYRHLACHEEIVVRKQRIINLSRDRKQSFGISEVNQLSSSIPKRCDFVMTSRLEANGVFTETFVDYNGQVASPQAIKKALELEGIVFIHTDWKQRGVAVAGDTSGDTSDKLLSEHVDNKIINFTNSIGGCLTNHNTNNNNNNNKNSNLNSEGNRDDVNYADGDQQVYVWDVKPQQGGQLGVPPSHQHHVARSHTSSEFYLHTDCSYEESNPEYISLYCLSSDKLGGGVSMIIPVSILLLHLPLHVIDFLLTFKYDIKIPPEFQSLHAGNSTATQHSRSTLLYKIGDQIHMRYRHDIIEVLESPDDGCEKDHVHHGGFADECNTIAKKAIYCLNLLHRVLTTDVIKHMDVFALPENTLLLLNNSLYLHGRSEILDSRRWLKRTRFNL